MQNIDLGIVAYQFHRQIPMFPIAILVESLGTRAYGRTTQKHDNRGMQMFRNLVVRAFKLPFLLYQTGEGRIRNY